jgi:hypothetical protein
VTRDVRPQYTFDVGCGPGASTRLVADVTGEISWGMRQVVYERVVQGASPARR